MTFFRYDQTQQMVGVKLCPSGKAETQIADMIDISNKEARLLSKTNLKYDQVFISLTRSAIHSLTYPLPCLSIDRDQSKKIM